LSGNLKELKVFIALWLDYLDHDWIVRDSICVRFNGATPEVATKEDFGVRVRPVYFEGKRVTWQVISLVGTQLPKGELGRRQGEVSRLDLGYILRDKDVE